MGTLWQVYARLCAAFMQVAYAKSHVLNESFQTFHYARFMRVIHMPRMLQGLPYAGFMRDFFDTFFLGKLFNFAGQ